MEDYGAFKLPAADESIADKAARAIADSGNNPETASAGQRLASLADQATKYQVGGYSLSNMGTKAKEGALALASSFGLKIPDASKKLGALGGANPLAPSSAIGTSTVSAAQTKAEAGINMNDREYYVSLQDDEGYLLEFIVMPEVVEQRQVGYEPVAPPQFPGAFQKYKGTESVTWQLNCTFISRTTNEASLNLRHLARLRGWTMPYFGNNTAAYEQFKSKIGAPPPVLRLKGFRGLVGEVPVVITSLNWNWPRDVDYIPAFDPVQVGPENDPQELRVPPSDPTTPFPAVMQVAISVVESFSTTEFNRFDLMAYRLGKTKQAYSNRTAGESGGGGGTNSGGEGDKPDSQEEQQVVSSTTGIAQTTAGAGRSAPAYSDTDPRRFGLSKPLTTVAAKATEVVKNVKSVVTNPFTAAGRG